MNESIRAILYYEGFSFDLDRELVRIDKNQEHKLSVSFASNLLAVYILSIRIC